MKYVVSRYNNDLAWLKDYSDDVVIYDRSPEPLSGAIVVPNIGSDLYDKFSFMIDHYDDLPDVAVYTKGNLFKYISKEEFDLVKDSRISTPLLTRHHRTYLPICFYDEDGMYCELNNSWYLGTAEVKYYPLGYNQYAADFGLSTPEYLKFAPGSNYILTKEVIRSRPKSFYEKQREKISWAVYPAECQMVERSLYEIWHG